MFRPHRRGRSSISHKVVGPLEDASIAFGYYGDRLEFVEVEAYLIIVSVCLFNTKLEQLRWLNSFERPAAIIETTS